MLITQHCLILVFLLASILQVQSNGFQNLPYGNEEEWTRAGRLLNQQGEEPIAEEYDNETLGLLQISGDLTDEIEQGVGVVLRIEDGQLIAEDEDSISSLLPIFTMLFLQRTVIGTDQRKQVPDTSQSPFNSIGQIGDYCTGTVIGPRHVITAAHCVVSRTTRQVFTDFGFTPGRDGTYMPFGQYFADKVFYPDEFLSSDVNVFTKHDYAVIVLKNYLSSEITPYKLLSPCATTRYHLLNILGYPNDKQPKNTMWATHCQAVLMNCASVTFQHKCDTFRGQSGSSMFGARTDENGVMQYLVKGIHSRYENTGDGSPINVGTIITKDVKSYVENIIASNP